MSSNNFLSFFFFYIYKISEDSSVRYDQNNKGRLQKKVVKYIKVFLSKKKEKGDNMVVNDT